MDKKQLRKEIIDLRDALSAAERTAKAKIIINKILATEFYKNANHIMLFAAFGSELNLLPLIKSIIAAGKHAYLPVVDKKTNSILPVEVYRLEDLKPGCYGIPEPSLNNYLEAKANLLELIITPAVAFDNDKYRIGYGAGYYDRFFASLKKDIIKIGVGFDEQMVQEVPREAHDIQLDYILTDKRMID
ncbi:MAG: 5-formyltetrahydrofolate cyclo-ligase [Acidaminococcaceae bacterium]